MLALSLSDFAIELKDGTIANVGGPTKSADAKLFDVEVAEARAFGDKRVKLVFADADGNEVQVSLFPEQAEAVIDDLDRLREDSAIFE